MKSFAPTLCSCEQHCNGLSSIGSCGVALKAPLSTVQKSLGENLRLCEKLTSANMRIPLPLIHVCVLLGLVSFEDGHSGTASVFLLITFYPRSEREKLGFIWVIPICYFSFHTQNGRRERMEKTRILRPVRLSWCFCTF